MPGKSLFHDASGNGHPALPTAAVPTRKLLHVVDATLPAGSPGSAIGELTEAATAAVRAGRGHVLDTSHVIFPNGAVTLVLILAESHLAIHTWPEEDRIAIDLFSCGSIDADRVAAELVRSLGLTDVRAQRLDRDAPLGGAAPGEGAPDRGVSGQGIPGRGVSDQAGTDQDSPN